MSIVSDGRKLERVSFRLEEDFERDIVASYRQLLGSGSVYIDTKRKIESRTLGAAVPDGFLFDFGDPTDPQFYIVEFELASHGFYEHIFPQVTKFFAFFSSTSLQKALVDKLFAIIDADTDLRGRMEAVLGQSEIYKFLSDMVESSQNILLIADGPIEQLPDIMDTYTDTWGRMVRFLEIRKYVSDDHSVYSITPDVETLRYSGAEAAGLGEMEPELQPYTEEFHLDGVLPVVRDIYQRIKAAAGLPDIQLALNPQKYYISLRTNRNVAYLTIRKKKIRLVAMLPEDRVREIVGSHSIISLSDSVQAYYNGPCAAVDIDALEDFAEIEDLLRKLPRVDARTTN